MTDIAVVSASYGGYDYAHGTSQHRDDVDYIYYTTDKQELPPFWEKRDLPHHGFLDNRRLSKWPKINPHALTDLSEYRYVIWIDGSMTINDADFPHKILEYLDHGMVISPHFDGRDCAYGEATIRPAKYRNEPLDEQVAAYRYEGFPEGFGLYECGVMARDMTAPGVREVGELWHLQNLMWSYQDQVSLPYTFWRTGFVPDVLPQPWRDMGWLTVSAHKRED